jgi:hypothetical protein
VLNQGDYSWILLIVLRTGRNIRVHCTLRSPIPETLVAVRQVATRYGIPADLAGVSDEERAARPARSDRAVVGSWAHHKHLSGWGFWTFGGLAALYAFVAWRNRRLFRKLDDAANRALGAPARAAGTLFPAEVTESFPSAC